MRKIAMVLAAAGVMVATPAAAEGEVRAEARGGLIWVGDVNEATAGVAVGYDVLPRDNVFVGFELSGDRVLVDGADVALGTTARFGGIIADSGKLYATLGYTFGLGENSGDALHLGGGYHHKLSDTLYVGAEYRHFIADFADSDAVNIAVGVTF